MIQKIYKGTDLLFSINIEDNEGNILKIGDVAELTMSFYTDSTNIENYIIINKDDIINDNQIFIDNTKLDLLNEGLLKYKTEIRFNYTSVGDFDIAKTVETEYFIKNDNFNDSTCTGGTVSDTYSKSEIDLKLSLKANISDVYSKAETNEKLADKANKTDLPDISILATKNELNLKANKSDVYSKVEIDAKFDDIEEVDLTNYYTKIEVDDLITSAGTIDLSNYYKKTEVDNKLSTKVDVVEGKSLSTNDYTDADKTKLQSLSNYDDTSIRQLITTKADANNVYTKNEVDAKIDDAIAGEVDLSAYYKKNEIDSKLSTKANLSDISDMATKTELATKANISDIPDTSSLATKTELAAKANSSDVYSKDELYTKTEIDDLIADIQPGTGTTIDTYTKSQIDTKLASKTDVSRTTTIELDLKKKANSDDVYSKTEVYNKEEVDDLIASAGTGTGGTGTSITADVLSWKETIASEERAALYNKLLNNIYSKTASFVFLDLADGNRKYMIDISNCMDEGLSRNEIKMYGSTISSASTTVSIFNIEVILKKDGSFTINKKTSELYNKAEVDRLLSMKQDLTTIEARIAVLESEIKNPTEMKVDCSKF